MLARGAIALITFYQRTLSPDHGPLKALYPHGYCRHSPTCSEYAKEIIARRGFFLGVPRAVLRVLSCNPWTKPSDEKILEVDRRFR